jgi:hypothetical protein
MKQLRNEMLKSKKFLVQLYKSKYPYQVAKIIRQASESELDTLISVLVEINKKVIPLHGQFRKRIRNSKKEDHLFLLSDDDSLSEIKKDKDSKTEFLKAITIYPQLLYCLFNKNAG